MERGDLCARTLRSGERTGAAPATGKQSRPRASQSVDLADGLESVQMNGIVGRLQAMATGNEGKKGYDNSRRNEASLCSANWSTIASHSDIPIKHGMVDVCFSCLAVVSLTGEGTRRAPKEGPAGRTEISRNAQATRKMVQTRNQSRDGQLGDSAKAKL